MMEQLPEDDPERQVETLRQFQRAAIFRIAVADLTGLLPVMKVSDRLTEVAELIVERAMALGWQQMTAQFGVPMCDDGRRTRRAGARLRRGLRQARRHGARLLLGSRPRVPARFERRAPGNGRSASRSTISSSSCGSRSASCTCSRCIRAAGRLYEVDVRLRPSGKGGMLITNIRAFAEYQQQGSVDLGAPGAAACAGCRRLAGAARRVRAPCAWSRSQSRAPRHAARRSGVACASACARS